MASAAFFHDHRFYRTGCRYYASSLSADVWKERYLPYFDKLVVTGRLLTISSTDPRCSLSTCERVVFNCVPSTGGVRELLNKSKVNRIIDASLVQADCAIVRLPSMLGFSALRRCKALGVPYLIELVACPKDAFGNHGLKGGIVARYMTSQTRKFVYEAPYVEYVTRGFLQGRYPTAGRALACSDVRLSQLDGEVLGRRIKKINEKKPGEPFVLGTIGALNVSYKAQERVLEAIAILHEIDSSKTYVYQVVGTGSSRRLRDIAKSKGVEENLEIVGQLAHDDIFKWLDQIDLYVQPSKQEGLPRALIEAMSRGVPAIGSDAGGIPELLPSDYIVKGSSSFSRDLAELLMKVNQDSLEISAVRNFTEASKYEADVLKARRSSFMNEFCASVTSR